MRVGILVALIALHVSAQGSAQEMVISPESARTIADSQGRGLVLVEFDLCQVEPDGRVVNGILEWEPDRSAVGGDAYYWAHVLEVHDPADWEEDAWDLLESAPSAMWDIPAEQEGLDGTRVRLVLPSIARSLRDGEACSVTILLGSQFVPVDGLALESVVLRLSTIPGVD